MGLTHGSCELPEASKYPNTRSDSLSGIVRTGYTVLGISPTRGDTLVISEDTTFASPRTGTVQQLFDFQVFNHDPLQLPDTMLYEVFGYSVDASGNCAASVGEPQLVSYVCGLQGVNTVAIGSLTPHHISLTHWLIIS